MEKANFLVTVTAFVGFKHSVFQGAVANGILVFPLFYRSSHGFLTVPTVTNGHVRGTAQRCNKTPSNATIKSRERENYIVLSVRLNRPRTAVKIDILVPQSIRKRSSKGFQVGRGGDARAGIGDVMGSLITTITSLNERRFSLRLRLRPSNHDVGPRRKIVTFFTLNENNHDARYAMLSYFQPSIFL